MLAAVTHATVADPTDAANRVLHLVATGMTKSFFGNTVLDGLDRAEAQAVAAPDEPHGQAVPLCGRAEARELSVVRRRAGHDGGADAEVAREIDEEKRDAGGDRLCPGDEPALRGRPPAGRSV